MTQKDFIDYILKEFESSNYLIIGGYPCCGKTTISKLIAKKLSNCVVVEAEHWLYSQKYRIKNNLSGSHPLSYNVKKSLSDIETLIEKGEINLPIYAHRIGDFDQQLNVKMNNNTKVIFDGTIFTLKEYSQITDLVFLLVPHNYETWLENAIVRDIETRHYSRRGSIEHNQRKYNDMKKVLKLSRNCKVVECNHSGNFQYNV